LAILTWAPEVVVGAEDVVDVAAVVLGGVVNMSLKLEDLATKDWSHTWSKLDT
jgi:hypothetical protein